MNATITLRVLGKPAPQGSKRFMGLTPNGKPKMIESSKQGVDAWRRDVVEAAVRVLENASLARFGAPAGYWPQEYPLNEPLAVSMVFTTVRPKNHYRTGRNAHLLHERAPARPSGKPDLSKLLRSTEDALTTAGLIKDDALIVEYDRAAKVYVGEDPDALEVPGVVIRLRPAQSGGRLLREQTLPLELIDLRGE